MAYISKDGKMKWEGAKPDADGTYLECEKCGSKKIKLLAHWDGRDAYGYGYNCENGHYITKTMRRDGGVME